MILEDIVFTNHQKVLMYLLLHPGRSCYEREAARAVKISYGSANHVLNYLYKKGFLKRETKGRMCFYSVELSNPYIKELKILYNLLLLESLVEKLKSHTHKVVLYGSWANGTDTENSDIDIFIVTPSEEKARSIIDKFSYSDKAGGRKIQAVIYSPEDLLKREEKERIFLSEVEKGKVLWEREINEDNL